MSSETSAGRYYTETGRTLKQWLRLKPYSERDLFDKGRLDDFNIACTDQ